MQVASLGKTPALGALLVALCALTSVPITKAVVTLFEVSTVQSCVSTVA
jgi:hypothetical protein